MTNDRPVRVVTGNLVRWRGGQLGRDIGGCNPTTLTQRLERLESMGIVSKTVRSTMPPRTLYTLSEAGRELEGVIRAVGGWGERFLGRVAV